MSDYFEMLVDVEVTEEHAADLGLKVGKFFQEVGLISGQSNRDCVLGGEGYLPGPAIKKLYEGGEEQPFWELAVCGVEFVVLRGFNEWALGPAFENIVCPRCSTKIETLSDAFSDPVVESIGEWLEQSGSGLLVCPACQSGSTINDWQSKPPLGFGNLALRFWNWPPLDSSDWKIKIPSLFAEATKHSIVRTWGHF